jgi:hypothetical protein
MVAVVQSWIDEFKIRNRHALESLYRCRINLKKTDSGRRTTIAGEYVIDTKTISTQTEAGNPDCSRRSASHYCPDNYGN